MLTASLNFCFPKNLPKECWICEQKYVKGFKFMMEFWQDKLIKIWRLPIKQSSYLHTIINELRWIKKERYKFSPANITCIHIYKICTLPLFSFNSELPSCCLNIFWKIFKVRVSVHLAQFNLHWLAEVF